MSDGYYVEWIRPGWVKEDQDAPGFDLDNVEENRKMLTELWLAKKDTFEEQFFSFKIPVWDEEGSR